MNSDPTSSLRILTREGQKVTHPLSHNRVQKTTAVGSPEEARGTEGLAELPGAGVDGGRDA